jgi:hypothetical protein
MRLRRPFLVAALLLSAFPAALLAGPWALSTADGGYNAGWTTSLRLDASGLPRIAYWTPGVGVRFASFDGSGWQTETVPRNAATPADARNPGVSIAAGEPAAPEGALLIRTIATSLALDPEGEPWVAHTLIDQDNGNQGLLEVSHRAAGIWTTENLTTANTAPSIAVDAAGTVHVCFGSPSGLMYAARTAAGWAYATVDAGSTYGAVPSLSLDALDQPHVAYLSYVPYEIRYASLVAGAWQSEPVDATPAVNGPSLAIYGADRPCMAYVRWVASGDSRLRYAHRTSSGWSCEELDPLITKAYEVSLVLGPNAEPLIGFCRPDLTLAFATFGGSWYVEAVAPYGNYPSIALSPQGQPLIAHQANINLGLRLATSAAMVGVAPEGPRGPFRLLACAPNPLRRGQSIGLVLLSPHADQVRCEAFDVSGRLLAARAVCPIPAGLSRLAWDTPLPPGLCFIRVRSASGAEARTRIVVLD